MQLLDSRRSTKLYTSIIYWPFGDRINFLFARLFHILTHRVDEIPVRTPDSDQTMPVFTIVKCAFERTQNWPQLHGLTVINATNPLNVICLCSLLFSFTDRLDRGCCSAEVRIGHRLQRTSDRKSKMKRCFACTLYVWRACTRPVKTGIDSALVSNCKKKTDDRIRGVFFAALNGRGWCAIKPLIYFHYKLTCTLYVIYGICADLGSLAMSKKWAASGQDARWPYSKRAVNLKSMRSPYTFSHIYRT